MLVVGHSSIHGRGCFAAEPIGADALIGRCECVTPADPDGPHVLWIDEEPLHVTNELRFLNHAAEPNAVLDVELELRALRAIAAGEEITIHYGADWDGISS